MKVYDGQMIIETRNEKRLELDNLVYQNNSQMLDEYLNKNHLKNSQKVIKHIKYRCYIILLNLLCLI